MVAIKASNLRNNFKDICEKVYEGETVIVTRPRNENVVVISEREYNQKEKMLRNIAYINKIENAYQELKDGSTISFSNEELEAFETMTPDESKIFMQSKA